MVRNQMYTRKDSKAEKHEIKFKLMGIICKQS